MNKVSFYNLHASPFEFEIVCREEDTEKVEALYQSVYSGDEYTVTIETYYEDE